MAISKIVLDGEVQMDVTQDTVAPNYLLAGYTATAANGEKVEGNIETKSSSDISVDGPTVTIPEGYYDSEQTATVESGYLYNPNIIKGAVSNHSVSVRATASTRAGYIPARNVISDAETITASDLVSGGKTITSNGTTDVTNYKDVYVNVQPNNQNKTVNPSLSQQIVNADSGYTGLGTVTVTAIPTGTVYTPSASKGTVSNHSVSVTPRVTTTAGYVTSGTKVGNSVTVSASELVSGSQTLNYNQTYDVTNLASVTVDVEGGGVPINNQTKTVSPSTSQQTVTYDSGYTGLETVTVNAMPSGTEGTPVAEVTTDQSTQNIVVTPKATNSAGYISGGLRVGESVTINPGVTTFNGQSGDVTYTAPVTSVNGSTGVVTVNVPTKVSQLTNDSGFLTSSTGVSSVNGSHGAVTITVPTKTSQLTNDSGFITSSSLPPTPSVYVTANGTTSGWTYRKWSDKTYECWKAVSFNMTVDGQWYEHFYKSVSAQSYPVTFTSAPFEQATVTSGSKSLFLANDGSAAQTTTKTAGYLVLRPTDAQQTISFIISYYVKGTVSS